MAKSVIIHGKIYESVAEAGRCLEIAPITVLRRVESAEIEWVEWNYLQSQEVPKKKQQVLCVCYRLTHLPSQKFYIGSTRHYPTRKASHLWMLRNNRHTCKKLQELWNQDNAETNWQWLAIIYNTREEAYAEEQKNLDEFTGSQSLLNSVIDAKSPIVEVMQRPGYKDGRARKIAEAYSLKPEDWKKDFVENMSRRANKRWSVPGAKEKWKGGSNPFAKKVSVDGIIYGSVKEAQAILGINEKTIRKRANSQYYPQYTFEMSVTSSPPISN